jgi:uncharacterized protein YjiS (DUF1127 family)
MTSQRNLSRHGAPPTAPSGADLTAPAIATHLQRGRYLRSEALFRGIGGAIDVLGGAYRALREGLRRHNAHRAAITELSRMNTHVLADIGIQREQIPMIVEGLLERRASTPVPSPGTENTPAASPSRDLGCGRAASEEHCCPPLAA